MTNDVLTFAKKLARLQPSGSMLEVGSRNINGTLRDVLPITLGIDMVEGKDVDEVLKAEDLPSLNMTFDHVVSADMLEHAEDWKGALTGMWSVLKPGGYFMLTACNRHKGRHAYPHDYWRFSPEIYAAVFQDQETIAQETHNFNECILVRKMTGGLNLEVNAQMVDEVCRARA